MLGVWLWFVYMEKKLVAIHKMCLIWAGNCSILYDFVYIEKKLVIIHTEMLNLCAVERDFFLYTQYG